LISNLTLISFKIKQIPTDLTVASDHKELILTHLNRIK